MEASSSRDKQNGHHMTSVMKKIKTMEKKMRKMEKKRLKKKNRKKRRLSDKKRSSLKRKRLPSFSSSSTDKSSSTTSREGSSTDGNSSSNEDESESSFTTNSSRVQKNSKASTSTQSPRKRSRKSCFNKSQTNKRIREILDDSLGESINDVPERIKNSLSNDIDESEYFELMKKYKVPLNFSTIKPIIIPEDMKLSCKIRNLDDNFVSTQTKLSSVISAIISSLTNVRMGPLSIKTWCKDTKNKLEDAAVLSIYLQNEIKEFRLSNIMKEIKSRSDKEELYSMFYTEYDGNDDETITSDDERVLNYLENVSGDNDKLPLPELSRKLVFLLHYNSLKNIETLSKLKLSKITSIGNGRKFEVPEEQVEFVIEKNDNSKLCVIEVLEAYLAQTRQLRGDEDHLFLMNKRRGHHNPAVSSRRISDWINELRRESHEWNSRNKK